MVLRNSGRVGSRRFFRERSPCIGRCRGFLVFGLFCLPRLILALFCLLCFSLFCFACFLGVSRFLVGIILYLWSIFLSLLLGYYIVSHHTHITSYIWQASPLMPFCSYLWKLLCCARDGKYRGWSLYANRVSRKLRWMACVLFRYMSALNGALLLLLPHITYSGRSQNDNFYHLLVG